MEYLRWCKDNMMWHYFQLGIVDPPYGINVGDMWLGATVESAAKRGYKMGKWDGKVPTPEYWELIKYCCQNIIVWGGNYFTTYIPPGRCFIVWDKMNDGLSFAAGELALTTFDKNAVILRRPRNSKNVDESIKDKRHPTQKPIYLYDYLHLNFVVRKMGWNRVLDTHGGSMSHAIAAFKNNVELTIIEADEDYFNDGLAAYEAASVKGRLLF